MKLKISYRKVLLMVADVMILAFGCIVSEYLCARLGSDTFTVYRTNGVASVVIEYAVLGFLMLGIGGEYRKAWRFLGVRDYMSCALEVFVSTVASGTVLYLLLKKGANELNFWFFAFYFLAFAISTALIIFLRMMVKRYFIAIMNVGREELMKNTLIIGAGNGGRMLALEIDSGVNQGKKDLNYNIIGFVDDNPTLVNETVNGHSVLGTVKDIETICKVSKIEVIFFAIPSCTGKRRAEILESCSKTGCEVKILPEISNLITDKSVVNQAVKIKVEDLLGREPIKLDTTKIKTFITGKVCMVTGGGGSIGSELCRQIIRYDPKQLIIIDIYENNAYEIQQEIFINSYDKADRLKVLIASVRDKEKMEKIFAEYKPQLVFHAAAHKHVPLMETSPEEAVKNNVFGTYTVAQLSKKYKAEKFVLVSTDKAVNPTNVMGATKRLCEMIVQYFAATSKDTDYAAVRFGNVLGSNGSVIPLFKREIESGKPVTVTHPDIIRYFMTIPEAVSLILTAGAMAHRGAIFVLDMGKPVKILDLAENLIKIYGKKPYEDVKIIFTGLRPGEKLFEELLMSEEGLEKTDNEKIFIGMRLDVDKEKLTDNLKKLKEVSDNNDSEGVVKVLEEIVPTFNHKTNK